MHLRRRRPAPPPLEPAPPLADVHGMHQLLLMKLVCALLLLQLLIKAIQHTTYCTVLALILACRAGAARRERTG